MVYGIELLLKTIDLKSIVSTFLFPSNHQTTNQLLLCPSSSVSLLRRPSASDLDGFDKLYSIPNWSAWDGATGEPRGATNNAVPSDKDGDSRSGQDAPGAYARA